MSATKHFAMTCDEHGISWDHAGGICAGYEYQFEHRHGFPFPGNRWVDILDFHFNLDGPRDVLDMMLIMWAFNKEGVS